MRPLPELFVPWPVLHGMQTMQTSHAATAATAPRRSSSYRIPYWLGMRSKWHARLLDLLDSTRETGGKENCQRLETFLSMAWIEMETKQALPSRGPQAIPYSAARAAAKSAGLVHTALTPHGLVMMVTLSPVSLSLAISCRLSPRRPSPSPSPLLYATLCPSVPHQTAILSTTDSRPSSALWL